MKINLSNSIINISKQAMVICNVEGKMIEIKDNDNFWAIYPATNKNMKKDFDKIKSKLKG